VRLLTDPESYGETITGYVYRAMLLRGFIHPESETTNALPVNRRQKKIVRGIGLHPRG